MTGVDLGLNNKNTVYVSKTINDIFGKLSHRHDF